MINKQDITVNKKRKGFTEPFDETKIHAAIRKSAERILQVMSDDDCKKVSQRVLELITDKEIGVKKLHRLVEVALDDTGFYKVAESYRQYRNYKEDSQRIMEAVDAKTLELSYKEDRSNANCDSTLVSTKRSILYGEMQKEKYERIFLSVEELEAIKDGYLYIHDRSARWDTYNCSVQNYKNILKGGFTLSNTEYNEPQSAAAAIAVLSDVMNVIASNQYGGNTVPEIDDILDEYCEKSYQFYLKQYNEIREGLDVDPEKADKFAEERVRRELAQGFQSIELTFNSVSSSRGDFPFIAVTFGHRTSRWAALVSSVILQVRKEGQGKPGHKIPVVFPKLIFIYDSELHGPGKELEWLFKEAVECTKIAQYPDYLSLDLPAEGESPNYIGEVYHKWGCVVSPMGCRSFISPMFKNSGTWEPADDNDEFLYHRCNLGVIALNLPMIYQKSKVEQKEYHEVLDYYLELTRGIHKRTFDYLCKLKASSSPLAFCEGGLDGGYLNPDDCIAPVLKNSTLSFGYGGLNELSLLATGKPLHEFQDFAVAELKYISDKCAEFKKQDGLLYAAYGIPGETALPLMNDQFIKKYGEVPGIIKKGGYLSNSFHCHVTADVTPIEKMDIESKFWNYSNGGKISHISINNIKNTEGIISLIRYGMSKGLYLGVNHPENHCIDCSSHWEGNDHEDDIDSLCPICGSGNIVKIRRMNGYLSYTRTRSGKARFHEGKLKEIKDRVNM